MPRPPKKSVPVETVTPVVPPQDNFVKITTQKSFLWLKSKAFLIFFGLIISLVSVLSTIFIQNLNKTDVNKSETISNANLDNERIQLLEKEIEKLINLNKKTEQNIDTLSNSVKSLEKRLQASTDVLKRMCEYIVVITVDKKIIPRQCLTDYNWKKEEGL